MNLSRRRPTTGRHRMRAAAVLTASMLIALVACSSAFAGCSGVGSGANANLGGNLPFPASNAWNKVVSGDPVDPRSSTIIANMSSTARLHPDFGAGTYNGNRIGIPYTVVPAG